MVNEAGLKTRNYENERSPHPAYLAYPAHLAHLA
jgi:hypothetical protein